MPRYRVTRQSFINGRVYGPDEKDKEVDFFGVPSDNLEPLDAEGVQARVDAEKQFKEERAKAAIAANPEASAMMAIVLNQGKSDTSVPDPRAPVYSPTTEARGRKS